MKFIKFGVKYASPGKIIAGKKEIYVSWTVTVYKELGVETDTKALCSIKCICSSIGRF